MTEVSLLAVVKRAREILTPENAWIKGKYAATVMGDSASITLWDAGTKTEKLNPEAVCFCSVGALRRAELELTGRETGEYVGAAEKAARDCVPAEFIFEEAAAIVPFNDNLHTTHADVLGMFDCVIGKLEARESGNAQQ